MKIGYVRVSKQEQNEELQIDALNGVKDLLFLTPLFQRGLPGRQASR